METLFEETVDKKMMIVYQSVAYGWLLAINKNGKLRKALKSSQRNGHYHRSAQFLAIFPEVITREGKKYSSRIP